MRIYKASIKYTIGLASLLLTACSSPGPIPHVDATADRPFLPAASFEQVQEQHRRLPDDEIWWTVNGPDMAWNNKNLHQLFPTVNVYRSGPVSTLASEPMPEIAGYPVATPAGEMTFDEFVDSDQSTVLGVIILHEGRIVYERYPRMQPYEMPVYWSVAKAFVGTVIRILEERGEIDVSRPIETYIPELTTSSFAGITVRNILDMATGLDCADEYEDRSSCYYRYSMAIGDGFRTPDAPDNPYDFVASLEAERLVEQGRRFSYSGLNTFVLAWLVEKVTDMPFQDAFTREVWYHIGAESNASYIAPRHGVAVTHGGFVARLRDVARFGLLFTPSYSVVTDRPIISPGHVRFLLDSGRPGLIRDGQSYDADAMGIRYNIYQWDQVMTNGDIYKGGWAGQGLLINPERDVVAVFTGYFKDDDYSEIPAEPIIRRMLDDLFGD